MKYSYYYGINRRATLSFMVVLVVASFLFLAVMFINVLGVRNSQAEAKGSSSVSQSTVSLPVQYGNCEDDFIYPGADFNDYSSMYYPLIHDKNPGVVNVLIGGLNGSGPIRPLAVCLSPDWSYKANLYADGFKIDYFYQGKLAINFSYAPGKTDIRFR